MSIEPIQATDAKRQQGSSQQRQPSQEQAQYFKKLLSSSRDDERKTLPSLLALLMLPLSWFNIAADKLSNENELSRSKGVSDGIDKTIQQFASTAFAPLSTELSKNQGTLTLRVVSEGNMFGAEMHVAAMQGQDEQKKIRMTISAASTKQLKALKQIQQKLESTAPTGYKLEIQIKHPHG